MKRFAIFLSFSSALAFQVQVENAKVETKPFVGSVENTLRQFGSGPLWAAWTEPARANREGTMCGWSHSRQTSLHLEGYKEINILVRIEGGKAEKLQLTSPDCQIDAGGLPLIQIQNVPPPESVKWLKERVASDHPDSAMVAIALHEAKVSDPVLDQLVEPSQPEKIRRKAVFWLGQAAGKHGVDVLRRVLRSDGAENVRREVTFALSQSRETEALTLLIDTAKNDRSAGVRSQAIFWLGQKAGNKQAAEVIANAVNDPERQVKEKAIFALSQMPNGEGIPRLIDLTKTSKDPEIRRKAMFWLGQSKDFRALEYFEQVLR